MNKTEIHLNSAEDTVRLGALIGQNVSGRLVLALIGDLGAGKTTLTQGLAQALGVEDAVSSPTFLMLNEYNAQEVPLYHFDLYRLQEDLDLDSRAVANLKFELDEIMETFPRVVAVVEWLNLWEDFSSDYSELRICIEYVAEGGRKAVLTSRGNEAEKVLAACQEKIAAFSKSGL